MDRSAAVRFSRRRALLRFAAVVALPLLSACGTSGPSPVSTAQPVPASLWLRKTATRHTDTGPAVTNARPAIANVGAAARPGQADVPDGRAAHRSQPKPRPS